MRNLRPIAVVAALLGILVCTASAGFAAITVTSAVSYHANCPNPNLCRYVVMGTATGFGANATIQVRLYDGFNVQIGATQTKVITDGNGNWGFSFYAFCGAVTAKAKLIDTAGKAEQAIAERLGRPPVIAVDDSTASAVATGIDTPTTNQYGLIALTLALLGAAGVVMVRRARA